MGKPGPISLIVCAVFALAVLFVSLVFMPAAELLPAVVFPAQRTSGESFVPDLPGAKDLLAKYADTGVHILSMLPKPKVQGQLQAAADKEDVVKAWKEKLDTDNGPKYSEERQKNIEQMVGGEQNLKTVLELLHVDKNYLYNAYALFLGLALFAGAVAIQAMGRWGAEEKTILPVKK